MAHAIEASVFCHSEAHLNTSFCYSSAAYLWWGQVTGCESWLLSCVSFWLLCIDAHTLSEAQEDMQTLAPGMLESWQW